MKGWMQSQNDKLFLKIFFFENYKIKIEYNDKITF